MARFTDEWLSQLLDKNDIVDVIGGYLPLQKRGANYWAKCPWHGETRPSFSVTPSKQMFYCFSCRKGGSAITFVMEYEKLSYPEAVGKLAERVGMELPETTYDPNYKKKQENAKRLKELMVETARYFHNNLKTPEGAAGLNYLKKRGIYPQINKFGLGYALEGFDDLVNHLKAKGYTAKEMLDAGVAKQKGSRIYDTFRDRAMFPIMDVTGSVIAFGGRIIAEGEPKYLNSPETLLFNKRRNLYNLSQVKKEKDLKAIILTEGYMDVVALAAAGVNTAVASLGTALSEEQARLLKRFTNKIYLNYDGDGPGIKAALRACDILTRAGLLVYVIRLPEGLDPDEIIKKYGVEKYYEYAKKASPAFEFKLNMLKANYNIKNQDELMQYAKAASKLIKELDGVEQERYVKYLSRETGIYENTIMREINGSSEKSTGEAPASAPAITFGSPEEKLLSLIIQHPEILQNTDVDESIIENPLYREIIVYAKDKIKKGFSPNPAEILSLFAEKGLDPSLAAAENIPENASKNDIIRGYLQEIELKKANNRKKELLGKINTAEGKERIELLGKISEADKEIQAIRLKYI